MKSPKENWYLVFSDRADAMKPKLLNRLLQWQYGMEARITSRFLAKDTMPNFWPKKHTTMQLHPQGNL